jgi:hypothetical protein
MSAFTKMADRYEEVEAENERLYMQVRRLKAENADLLAGMKSLQHLFSQRRSARSMVELAQQCVDLRVAKTEEGE